MPVRSMPNAGATLNAHVGPLPQQEEELRPNARDEVQSAAGEDYDRRPYCGSGWEQRVFAQLLKSAGYQPEGQTDHDGGAERDDRALAAERDCQRHSDQSHHDHTEWGRIFPL